MLETVKANIAELPYLSFPEFFTHYVMNVQDINILEELKYLQVRNLLDIRTVDRIIDTAYKELKTL